MTDAVTDNRPTDVVFGVRDADEDDLPFILSSWTKSARHSGDHKAMSREAYYDHIRRRVLHRLQESKVLIAHNLEDPWHVFGYAVFELRPNPIVHYVYVKFPFRRVGIARKLFEIAVGDERPVVCTSTGALFPQLRARYGLEFNPWV